MFQRYFEDEVQFLDQMGDEFARAYPDIAAELRLKSKDPDVERLLQGVAFLTGRIRQSLDAEFPTLLYPLLQLLVPHALRPTPSAGIVEFRPVPNMLSKRLSLPRDTPINSIPVDGTVCQFRTCYDTDILPLRIEDARIEAPNASVAQLRISLKALAGPGLHVDVPLRLHLHGTVRQAYGLYLWLGRHLQRIRLRLLGPSGQRLNEITLPADHLRPVGFALRESLLPHHKYNFTGYRHLQEFFAFPAKYLFFDLHGLSKLGTHPGAEAIEIVFDLVPLKDEPLQVAKENLLLNCVPVVNLARIDAIVPVDGKRAEYHLRPLVKGSTDDPRHYDVFSVEKVEGHRKQDGKTQRNASKLTYHPFFSFHRPAARSGERPILYQLHLRPPVSRGGGGEQDHGGYRPVEPYLSFVDTKGDPVSHEATISVEMLVLNRDLPFRHLRAGDICTATTDILSSSVKVANIGPLSMPAPAPIGQNGLWRFFSHLLWGWGFLRDKEALRTLLALHHFPAMYDLRAAESLEQLQASIIKIAAYPDNLIHRLKDRPGPPAVLRGTRVDLHLDEQRFGHPGEIHLFGSVLSHFLAETASINTFSQLTVHGQARSLEFKYEPRAGRQDMLSDQPEPFPVPREPAP